MQQTNPPDNQQKQSLKTTTTKIVHKNTKCKLFLIFLDFYKLNNYFCQNYGTIHYKK